MPNTLYDTHCTVMTDSVSKAEARGMIFMAWLWGDSETRNGILSAAPTAQYLTQNCRVLRLTLQYHSEGICLCSDIVSRTHLCS